MKHALVTGGSRGIGRAICLKLAEAGFNVLINYKSNEAAALDTKDTIEKMGGTAELMPFDVADEQSIEQALEQWKTAHQDGYIEVLVNNAGIRSDNMLIFMQNEEWHKVIDTNLHSVFFITRRVMKDMLINKSGRVINMVSLSGIKGLPGQVNYSSTKAAVIGFTKSLAQEVGKKKVTINAVAPGFIDTDMTADIDESLHKKMIPLNRFGKPEEVADLVAFLASDKASYITGEVISINGGLYT